jgi:uncharacterized protein YacL
MYIAHTQARVTYMLLGAFVGLMFALLLVAIVALKVDEKILAILDRIVTAMLPIVGAAIGFWVARQRAGGVPDPTTTTTETRITTTPTPTVVPPGSTLVSAPAPPAAIVTTDPLVQPPEKPT